MGSSSGLYSETVTCATCSRKHYCVTSDRGTLLISPSGPALPLLDQEDCGGVRSRQTGNGRIDEFMGGDGAQNGVGTTGKLFTEKRFHTRLIAMRCTAALECDDSR